MLDVMALGEVLVDVIVSPEDSLKMNGNAGGAPANCMVAATQFGANAGVIAKVGNDTSGRWLRDMLEKHGVNTNYLTLSDEYNTTLAMVSLDKATGERSFSFYRRDCADVNLQWEDIPVEELKHLKIFHFGSVSMTEEPARSTTFAAAELARKNGVLVSFDPNLRANLWKDLDDAKKCIMAAMRYADLVKVSDDELLFLTGTSDEDKGAEILMQQENIRLLCITSGGKGSSCYTRSHRVHCNGFSVKAMDATGAGDAFDGAMISRLLKQGCCPERLTEEELMDFALFANAAGALTATRYGAIPAIPTNFEVMDFLSRQNELR